MKVDGYGNEVIVIVIVFVLCIVLHHIMNQY